MFVKEFGQTSARELNQQLEKVYKWQLDLNQISESDSDKMLGSLYGKIKKIRGTSQAHHAERNPEFMEAVMVSKVLESHKAELAGRRQKLAEFHNNLQKFMAVTERELTPAELKKREKYVMGMKPHKGDFEKRYGKDRGEGVMYATAATMAKKESVGEAIQVMRFALTEGEVEAARVTMAIRDMVDNMQDLVEKLGKMQNEQLPSLVSAMKDEIGMDQANQFNTTAGDALRAVMDAITASRDTMDNASRGVYGSQPMDTGADMGPEPAPDMGAEPAADMDAGMPPMEPESELDAADTATGGDAELGRGKRV
jgi:hypothetical protein